MPGLVAFGRRWEVASDDLVLPSMIESFVRLIWFIIVVIVWSYHAKYMSVCEEGRLFEMYLGGTLFVLMAIIGINVVLTKHSMKGAIMDVRARKHVPKILYIRLVLGIPELVWTVVGSVWVFGGITIDCAQSELTSTLRVVQGLVVFNWVLFFFFVVGAALVFDPLGHGHGADDLAFERRTRVWEWRCKFLCCSCCSASCCAPSTDGANFNDAFGDAASVLTVLFHDLDLVPSDIAAGLLLLHLRVKRGREVIRSLRRSSTQQQHQNQFQQQRPVQQSQPRSLVEVLTSSPAAEAALRAEFSPSALSVPPSAACSPNNGNGVVNTLPQLESIMEESSLGVQRSHVAYDWMNPLSAYMYMKYALGSYGWMWYLYSGFWNGIRTLRKEIVCCPCFRRRLTSATNDNCCHCNLAALKTVTDLEEKDILCVSFHNRVFEVPYFVAVDHCTCSIVVAIRGTLSGHDALTDLTAVTHPISVEGLPVGWTAHRGMLQSARYLLCQLEKNEILKSAFTQYPNYNLVVTGHSLGAGAAVLLSMLLKPKYPNVRCFAFSPPGGLLSLAAARFTETFCLSVVVGDDLVPRLSLSNLDALKRQMTLELESCRHPKYRIFLRGCWEIIFGGPRAGYQTPGTSHPLLSDTPNNVSYESFSEPPARFQSPSTNRSAAADQLLYLPGRILQVEEREPMDSATSLQEPMYEARWMQREDYNQIVVTPRMLSDHTPDTVVRVLRGLATQYESSISTTEPHEA